MNRRLGWGVLIVGFAWAAWLDPWSLSERDPSALVGSARMAARQAGAVVIAMAFLQLVVAEVAGRLPKSAALQAASMLTALGAMVYSLGFGLGIVWPPGIWLIPAGALLNTCGFAGLCAQSAGIASPETVADEYRDWSPRPITAILAIITFGMLLDGLMGLFAVNPARFLPEFLGPEDGVRLRMLRLARAAAVALPVLALLYMELPLHSGERTARAARWVLVGLLVGAATMPVILTVAAMLSLHFKYLLPIPAMAVFCGTLAGLWRASRVARPLELWGWSLVAGSLGIGLAMGFYAFDGPLASPDFLGSYNDYARRLSRLGHAYAVVLGLLSIVVARRLAAQATDWLSRTVVVLLVIGSVTTLATILLVATSLVPSAALGAGPALVGLAILVCTVVQ